MRKTLIPLLLALALLLPLSAAQAQNPVRFSAVEIDLWPEYDRPDILIIYRITLAADTALPADLSLRIPARVVEPNAVALKQPDGQLFNAEYTLRTSGDWLEISLKASMPELQVEYYDPGLVKDGSQRSFEYVWPADHAVDSLVVQVQQPLDGSDTSITPGPVASIVASDGLTYFTKDIGSVGLDQGFDLQISYQKSSDSLTVERQPVQPSAPLQTTPDWQASLGNALPWLAGILGLGLILGGGYWYWRTGQQQEKPSKRRTRRSRATESSEKDSGGSVYCHQCGHRAGPSDQFCRSCGAKLRVE